MDDYRYWIALKSINGVGDITFKRLLTEFQTPEKVFRADKGDLVKIEGLGQNVADQIKQFNDWKSIDDITGKFKRIGCRLLKYTDKDYPKNLLNIYNPPSFLYIKGDLNADDCKSVAVVGSRNPDRYGSAVTEKLVEDLVANGFTIISGMAKGIDTVAHKAALKHGGRTIAVLGSGLDCIYPYENRKLYHEISQNGAITTEYGLGTKPESVNFPRRNRIISGLAAGVLVVQAAENSGSLITADFALEQNREVFAVPGSIYNSLSSGTNRLIQRGAKLVSEINDILTELTNTGASDRVQQIKNKDDCAEELSKDEAEVYRHLSSQPVHIDRIINDTDLNPSQVLAILLSLELKDLIYQLPGKYYMLMN